MQQGIFLSPKCLIKCACIIISLKNLYNVSVIIFLCGYCLASLSSGLNLKNKTKASNKDATYRGYLTVVVDHAGSFSSSKGVQSEAERTI